jgi:hypothetical protein
MISFDFRSFHMKNGVDFQIVCNNCGGLAVKIENPVQASRESAVYCSDCGASRGSMGGLRDLAIRPDAHDAFLPKRRAPKVQSNGELVALFMELRRLRREVQLAESARS